MTAQDYILEQLNKLKTSRKPEKFDSEKDLEDFIFKAVMNKKFRKYSVTPEYQKRVRLAIQLNLKEHSAIKLRLGFGGYKLWRLEESPQVDWAEFFTLIYYAQWLKPITDNYKPGVWFDFSSDEIIVEKINNIPRVDLLAYQKTFRQLIEFLKNYTPKNLRFTLTPIRDWYTPEEFEADLQNKIERVKREEVELPKLDEKERKAIDLNVKLKPGQDTDPSWREKIRLIMKAYRLLDKRGAYTRAKDKIRVFCDQIGNCVAVGTTKTSIAKFWAGVGALKIKNDSYIEYVLSPSQLQNAKYDWESVSLKSLENKNFGKVRILK